MDLSQLLPFGEGGTKPILEGLMTFPMWFGDTAFLLLTLGKIKLSRGVVIGSMLTKLIASILIMLFSCTLFATYSNISTLIDYGNNVSNMTQFSLGSQDYGRFDLLFYCVWLFSVFIALAMVFRALTRSVEYVIGKTSRNHLLVTTIVAIILYITITFVLKNENTVYEFMTSAIKYVVYFPTVMLPTITLISSVIKYKPNRHLLTKKEKANETTFSTE
jgi:hypothetical protein